LYAINLIARFSSKKARASALKELLSVTHAGKGIDIKALTSICSSIRIKIREEKNIDDFLVYLNVEDKHNFHHIVVIGSHAYAYVAYRTKQNINGDHIVARPD